MVVVYGYFVRRDEVDKRDMMESDSDEDSCDNTWYHDWIEQEGWKDANAPAWFQEDVKQYDTFPVPHDMAAYLTEDNCEDGLIIGIQLMSVSKFMRNPSYVYDDIGALERRTHPIHGTPWRLFLMGDECMCSS